MIPSAFDYERAKTIDDALNALATGDGTKLVAGGHSLLPLLRFRLAEVSRLVDISGLSELKGITKTKGGVRIGAGTTYRELLDSDTLRASHPLVAEVTQGIGDRQVRNMGTIGGGLVHADPASDMPAIMLILNATFVLRSKSGGREVAAREFFHGPFTTAMQEDELLLAVTLPDLPKGTGTAYASFEQAASGYALVGAAAAVTLKNAVVERAALAFTGLGDHAFLTEVVSQLASTKGDDAAIARVATAAAQGVDASGDIHAPAEYRLHLATVAAKRALRAAVDRAG